MIKEKTHNGARWCIVATCRHLCLELTNELIVSDRFLSTDGKLFHADGTAAQQLRSFEDRNRPQFWFFVW